MAKSADDDEKLITRIKELGYRVRKPGKYVKASFLVHEDTLAKFKKLAEALNYQKQEAVTEALDLWNDSIEKQASRTKK